MTELILSVGSDSMRAFLQDGFRSATTTPRLHKHNYAEIHIVTGEMTVELSGSSHRLSPSEAIIIPAGSYHRIIPAEGTRRISFQLDRRCEAIKVARLPLGVVDALFYEVERAISARDFSLTSAYFSLVAASLIGERYAGESTVDYSLFIREFFSRRYAEDVRLCDLADELHLSERQTERLVIRHTGRCFRDELTATRIAVAEELLSEGRLSLGEIATYVGYRSYAGFFKAREKSRSSHR